jgi:hypothetical protein
MNDDVAGDALLRFSTSPRRSPRRQWRQRRRNSPFERPRGGMAGEGHEHCLDQSGVETRVQSLRREPGDPPPFIRYTRVA